MTPPLSNSCLRGWGTIFRTPWPIPSPDPLATPPTKDTRHILTNTFAFQFLPSHRFRLESHPCFDESSVYTGFDVGSLDYAIEAQRDSIEQAHNLLYDCLYPTSEALVNDSLADSDAGVINEENVYERWNTLCEDLIDDKAAYF